MTPTTLGRLGCTLDACSVTLLVVTGALGESAAQPGLGADAGPPWPPWSLSAHPSALLVTVLLLVALMLGAAGVTLAWTGVRRGWRPSARRLLAGSALAVVALLCVPPMGSADPLSYAAYGRIAASGANPYVTAPDRFRNDTDPVVSAVQPPWRSTPSVYGPLATAEQQFVSRIAGSSVRRTVLLLSLIGAVCFLLTGWLLSRVRPGDPTAVVLWSLNPLLLWALVAGAHVDALVAAPLAAALLLARRSRLAAGALIGVAAAVKLPALLMLGAWVCARRFRAWPALLGCLVVLLAGYAVAWPHAFDQVSRASRLVALASPWNPVSQWLDPQLGFASSRRLIGLMALALAGALALALHRSLPACDDNVLRWSVILFVAYLACAPYALPWYDALLWVPLAAYAVPKLVPWMIARSAVLASAYVPGRVVGVPASLDRVLLHWRGGIVPWLAWALIVVLVVKSLAGMRTPVTRPTLEQ